VPAGHSSLGCASAVGAETDTTAASARASAKTNPANAAGRPPLPKPFNSALIYLPSFWSGFLLPDTSSVFRPSRRGSPQTRDLHPRGAGGLRRPRGPQGGHSPPLPGSLVAEMPGPLRQEPPRDGGLHQTQGACRRSARGVRRTEQGGGSAARFRAGGPMAQEPSQGC
jgi:hypothetical protein